MFFIWLTKKISKSTFIFKYGENFRFNNSWVNMYNFNRLFFIYYIK
nr:MAG TPA: hypothetical protein [Caudoviricetes sp.]